MTFIDVTYCMVCLTCHGLKYVWNNYKGMSVLLYVQCLIEFLYCMSTSHTRCLIQSIKSFQFYFIINHSVFSIPSNLCHFYSRRELRYITRARDLIGLPLLLRRDWACVVRQQWWRKWGSQKTVFNLPIPWLVFKSVETDSQLQHSLMVRNTMIIINVTPLLTEL